MTQADETATRNDPFVLIVAGQSNIGFDTGGSKFIDADILVSNHLTNPTGFVRPAFGRPPLNLGWSNAELRLAWIETPEEAFNNIGIQFANHLRSSGLLPARRPILVIPNWFPGQSISQWVEAGAASRLWRCLVLHISLLAKVYPDCRIDHVIWAQGESDANSARSAYNALDTYTAAFDQLLGQFKALPQWDGEHTSISVQELADWPGCAKFNSRNDFIRTLADGRRYAEVATVSSQGLTESQLTKTPHFDAGSLLRLAEEHFRSWEKASSRRQEGQAGSITPDANAGPAITPFSLR